MHMVAGPREEGSIPILGNDLFDRIRSRGRSILYILVYISHRPYLLMNDSDVVSTVMHVMLTGLHQK